MKKALILAICLMMVLSFAGTGQVVASSTIDIGAILPLSGAASSNGVRIVDGMNLAIEQINSAGGIIGKQLNLITQDNRLDPAETVSIGERLIERDNVSVIVGAYASSATLALAPLTERYQVPHVVAISTSPAVTQTGSEWIFRLCSTNAIDAELIAEKLIDLGFTNNAYLPVDNDWGLSVAQSYQEPLEALGAETATIEPVAMSETQYLPQLSTVRASGANSMIATQDVEYLAIMVEQRFEVGVHNLNYISTSGTPLNIVIDLIDDAAEGIYGVEYYLPYPMGGDTPENKTFFEQFTEKYGYEPDYMAAQGYVVMTVIADAIERAGTDDRAAIRDALAETQMDTIRGYVEFDETGQSFTDVYIFQVQDGKLVKIY